MSWSHQLFKLNKQAKIETNCDSESEFYFIFYMDLVIHVGRLILFFSEDYPSQSKVSNHTKENSQDFVLSLCFCLHFVVDLKLAKLVF